MRYDVTGVWDPWQKELFDAQSDFEAKALELHKKGKKEELNSYLTNYTLEWGEKVVGKAWEMGDQLWTNYDEKF
jgi:hypothetical protein